MRKTITDTLVRRTTAPAPDGPRIQIYDTVLPGFGVRITAGARSWFVMTRLQNSEQVRVTLGRFPGVGVATARAEARKAIERAARGEDPRPVKTKNAPKVPGTVANVTAEFLERVAKHTKTYAETKRIIDKELIPAWGPRLLRHISRGMIVELLDGIVDRGAPVMANRTTSLIKRIIAYAIDRGIIDASPCAGLKPPGGKERSRTRVLAGDELVKVWNACDPAALGVVPATFVRVLLLTAQRRGEVATMRWADVDFASGVWRMEDTKPGGAHEVPFVPTVVELLRAMPRHEGCEYVFTSFGTKPINGFSKLTEAVRTAAEVDGWTLHDLRRTAASGMTALGVPPDHVERVLGHLLPGMRRVYVRHEFLAEKRAALERWANHVAEQLARAERGAAA